MTEYIIDWDTGLVIDTFSKNTLHEEIVRCRDCKWLLEDERYSEAACRFFCRTLPKEGYQDGFCKWGERREP